MSVVSFSDSLNHDAVMLELFSRKIKTSAVKNKTVAAAQCWTKNYWLLSFFWMVVDPMSTQTKPFFLRQSCRLA